MNIKKAVTYYRVSTPRQGESGFGLEAQQKSVYQYALANSIKVVEEFTEVESGRKNDRPVLGKALIRCKAESAILLIAKLDRLGRNVAFISALMESRVEFVAVDNPHATKIVLHVLAAFAEHERDMISTRTKEALQAAKKRGVVLGTNGIALAKKNRQEATDFAREMKPVIQKLNRNGITSVRGIVKALNTMSVPTFSKAGHWHTTTVHKLLCRIKDIKN